VSAPVPAPAAAPVPAPAARRKPADVTEEELAVALRACRWDLAQVASRIGLPRASIYLLIERSGRFRTARDLTPDEIASCHRECGGDLARMVDRLEVSERALARRVRELGLK
jgi:two-component system nitrogen regulation response regulator GlnG